MTRGEFHHDAVSVSSVVGYERGNADQGGLHPAWPLLQNSERAMSSRPGGGATNSTITGSPPLLGICTSIFRLGTDSPVHGILRSEHEPDLLTPFLFNGRQVQHEL